MDSQWPLRSKIVETTHTELSLVQGQPENTGLLYPYQGSLCLVHPFHARPMMLRQSKLWQQTLAPLGKRLLFLVSK
jgi:hypothetical protein